MDAAVLISGTCIPSILATCPNITYLSITGNQRTLGLVTLANLVPLATYPFFSTNAPKLKTLDLRRAIPGGSDLKWHEPLRAITAPASRKNKLEVLFQHPHSTANWQKTYKNGQAKRLRMTAQQKAVAAVRELLELARLQAEYDGSDSEESLTKSELSVLIHSAR